MEIKYEKIGKTTDFYADGEYFCKMSDDNEILLGGKAMKRDDAINLLDEVLRINRRIVWK